MSEEKRLLDNTMQSPDDRFWTCYYFYPEVFTPVCTTEIKQFEVLRPLFESEDCHLVAVNYADSIEQDKFFKSLDIGDKYIFAQDINHEQAKKFNAYSDELGICDRLVVICNPLGVAQFVQVFPQNIARSPANILSALIAIQSGDECDD